jgi:hypothetical protein
MLTTPSKTLAHITMQQAVAVLRGQKIPVCFEQAALDTTRYSRRDDGSIEYEQPHFDVEFASDSIETMLEVLCQADSRYTWESLGQRPTYTVYPAQHSVLDWQVTVTVPEKMPWREVVGQLGLAEHQMDIVTRGLDSFPTLTSQAAASPSLIRHVLSAWVDEAGDGIYWTLAGLSTRVLSFGKVG